MAARLAKAVGQQGLVPSLGLVPGFFQVSFGAPGSWRSSGAQEAKSHKTGALKASVCITSFNTLQPQTRAGEAEGCPPHTLPRYIL